MNKRIFIIIGLVLIALLLGFWGYTLVYGTPKPLEETFARFSSSNEPDQVITPAPGDSTSITQDTDTSTGVGSNFDDTATQEPLRQLTSEPVAGFTMVTPDNTVSDNSSVYVLYAKAGTGHIFRHDIATNIRDRITNFTIAEARDAHFTPDGTYAVVISGFGSSQLLHIFNLKSNADTAAEPKIVRINAQNITISDDGLLLYTVSRPAGTQATAYDFSTGTDRALFTTPLTNITVAWGATANANHFFYPRPAAGLKSPVFQASGNTIRRTPINEYNLELIYAGNVLAFSFDINSSDQRRESFATFTSDLEQRQPLNISIQKNTCTIQTPELTLICAERDFAPVTPIAHSRRGIAGANFIFLFAEQVGQGSSQSIANLERQAGRSIDISNLQITKVTDTSSVMLFRNNITRNLWLFEM